MATITKVTDNAHEHRRNKETIFAMMMMKNKMMMMNMNMMFGAKGKGKGASKKNMMYLYAQRGMSMKSSKGKMHSKKGKMHPKGKAGSAKDKTKKMRVKAQPGKGKGYYYMMKKNMFYNKAPIPPPTVLPTTLLPTLPPTAAAIATPTRAPIPVGPLCIDFDCGEGYLPRENPETRPGNDRATCCFREGVCAGAPEGSPCSLGDITASLIPNPSFEEFACCPDGPAQLTCADAWVQASEATSDFLVGSPSCDDSWFRNGLEGTIISAVTQQATDGDAFVGAFRTIDGTWNEYVGACLINPLQAGVDYTFSLDIAAATDTDSIGGDTNGATDLLCITDCNDFQIQERGYQGNNYEVLATAQPSGGLLGGGDWKSLTFTVNPSTDCPAIMFGPSSQQTVQSGQTGTYMLYDFLNLQEGEAGVCNAAGECVPVSTA